MAMKSNFHNWHLQGEVAKVKVEPPSEMGPEVKYIIDPSADANDVNIVKLGVSVLLDLISNSSVQPAFPSRCFTYDETGQVQKNDDSIKEDRKNFDCPACREPCSNLIDLLNHLDKHIDSAGPGRSPDEISGGPAVSSNRRPFTSTCEEQVCRVEESRQSSTSYSDQVYDADALKTGLPRRKSNAAVNLVHQDAVTSIYANLTQLSKDCDALVTASQTKHVCESQTPENRSQQLEVETASPCTSSCESRDTSSACTCNRKALQQRNIDTEPCQDGHMQLLQDDKENKENSNTLMLPFLKNLAQLIQNRRTQLQVLLESNHAGLLQNGSPTPSPLNTDPIERLPQDDEGHVQLRQQKRHNIRQAEDNPTALLQQEGNSETQLLQENISDAQLMRPDNGPMLPVRRRSRRHRVENPAVNLEVSSGEAQQNIRPPPGQAARYNAVATGETNSAKEPAEQEATTSLTVPTVTAASDGARVPKKKGRPKGVQTKRRHTDPKWSVITRNKQADLSHAVGRSFHNANLTLPTQTLVAQELMDKFQTNEPQNPTFGVDSWLPYKCSICGVTYGNDLRLAVHMKGTHRTL